ncbi:MAG: hypothetical protein V1781_08890, partial [Bacteroidota bacterium]
MYSCGSDSLFRQTATFLSTIFSRRQFPMSQQTLTKDKTTNRQQQVCAIAAILLVLSFVFHIFVSVSVDNFSLRKSATSQTCKTLCVMLGDSANIKHTVMKKTFTFADRNFKTMKKLLLILTVTTLTATGATVLYFRTGKTEQTKTEPSQTISATSVQTVQQEQPVTPTQSDTVKQTKSVDNSDCFSYECAYRQYLDMLEGKKPLDFKRAVFIYENTYLKGTLNYDEFSNHFATVAKQLRDYINKKGIAGYKTAGQYAIFSYMYEPSILNDNQVFKYDFNDFMGDKDWTSMFVTKVIRTKNGNCHGLPYYYKLLSDELNAESFLAIAPNHMYIKHIDENGKWVNVELTNGHLSSDAWMISSMG